jgi:hypothetical protein
MTASTGWRRTGAGSRRAYFLRVCGDGVDWGLVRAAAWRRFFFFFFFSLPAASRGLFRAEEDYAAAAGLLGAS